MTRSTPANATRRLIVNADDFGQTEGINAGIIECHRWGIVSSASLMVRWPAARAAAEYARHAPALSVGLHLDLGEWAYADNDWFPVYQVVDRDDFAAVRSEIERQFEAFRRLVGREPTHIDSHQHVHRHGAARTIAAEVADRFGIPVRGANAEVMYRGEFYGQTAKGYPDAAAVSVGRLIGLVRSLPNGTSEIGCHPAIARDAPGMYVAEREQEVAVLCDPRVLTALEAESIALISYHDLPKLAGGARAAQV
jgi:chitin disaccharide deacetylase